MKSMPAAATESLFPYEQADYEGLPCNSCGGVGQRTIAKRDRNGLAVRSVICNHCGLIYLSPRMTPQWYGLYYQKEYRRQMAAFKGQPTGKPVNHDKMFAAQRRRGEWLVQYLQRHGQPNPARVLEVGSSTGGMLRALADHCGSQVMGVEPSPVEAQYASAHGVPTEVGLFEQFSLDADRQFDLVICTQSFNHLLDPRGVAERIRACLSPGGLFFLECQDFFAVLQNRSCLEQAIQIDHVFMFTPATLAAIVEAAGFSVLPETLLRDRFQSPAALAAQKEFGVPSLHTRLLARPGQSQHSGGSSFAEIYAELCELERAVAERERQVRYDKLYQSVKQFPIRAMRRMRRVGQQLLRKAA
jgi:SAM-dependent methyltransferase